MPASQVFRSSSAGIQDSGKPGCSGLPRLSGSTRLHFPIREATKDKQLDCQIPHIPSISIIHTICSICVNTTWHHNITLQLKYYSLGSEERDITNMGLMTQQS